MPLLRICRVAECLLLRWSARRLFFGWHRAKRAGQSPPLQTHPRHGQLSCYSASFLGLSFLRKGRPGSFFAAALFSFGQFSRSDGETPFGCFTPWRLSLFSRRRFPGTYFALVGILIS